MEVIALFSVGLIRIYVMVFDKEGFIRVVLDFLSASVKNASEIEGCWNEMQQCINNMDRTVQSFAFAQWEHIRIKKASFIKSAKRKSSIQLMA